MKAKAENILKKAIGENVFLERPSEDYGDYSSNIAFKLSKKEKKSPQEIASRLSEEIKTDFFEKIEEKNGFLNFFLSQKALKEEFSLLIKEKEDYGRGKEGKTVLVDYSSPNIAKSFGVGHLRSTIIGQAIYNIYKFQGWRAVGVNHLGDWGTQYGKLLYQIKKEKKDPEKLSIKELEELYVRFHKEAEENPSTEEEGRKWFAKLEKGDKEARRIWKICKEKSLKEFQRIYDDLEIQIDYVLGESFYEDKLSDVVEEAKEKKVARESEGALIIDFDDMPSAMILKSDGGTTYLTRDLAAAKYRLEEFSPDFFIYEIGADQTLHMKQLFSAVEKLGWADKNSFVHMPHGMFRLKDGKFSTRKGKTVHLEEVLGLAKAKAREMIESSDSEKDISEKEKEEIAKIVGIGGVKYNDLKKHHKKEVVFSWDDILTLKGNSGPYLQYTCVRCKSLLEKGNGFEFELESLNKEERQLVVRILQFKETVKYSCENYSPNIVAEYAFKLAKDFNIFYSAYPILKNNKRMTITEGTYIILRQCLSLLTISVPKKM